MAALLEVENLSIDAAAKRPRRLVDGLSFRLEKGRTLALVGESGAGKSLTGLAVMNLLPGGVTRAAGRIRLEGADIAALPAEEARRMRGGRAAMIMQNPMSAFDPVFTIRSHFAETLRAHDVKPGRGAIADSARAALRSCGFDEPDSILGLYPFQMSGGMLQRVMIALALVTGPALLIADEATTDLDALTQEKIVRLLRGRQLAQGIGLLLITHDLSVAASLADEVLVMRQGRCVEAGKLRRVFENPRTDYARWLLEAHFRQYGGKFRELMEAARGEQHGAA